MARGRRSAPGRRSGVGADSGAGGADDDDEDTGRGDIDDPDTAGFDDVTDNEDTGRGDIDDEDTAGFDDVTEDDDPGPTSAEDLASVADPGEFDETFTDDDAPLSIAGNFDPSAGSKQVIPRIAFVLNYNLVYNESRDRWEPQKKGDNAAGAGATIAQTSPQSIPGTNTNEVIQFDTVEYDTGNNAFVGSNIIRVPADGLYMVTSSVSIDLLPDDIFLVHSARRRPSDFLTSATDNGDIADSKQVGISKVVELAEGDQIDATVRHNNGSPLDTSGFDTTCYLSVARLGPGTGP